MEAIIKTLFSPRMGVAAVLKQGPKGDTGDAAGFGVPTASASGLAAGATPTVSVSASGPDTAKAFAFSFGIPKGEKGDTGDAGRTGDTGATGAPGVAAGFGVPTASASIIAHDAAPTASVSASGPNTAKAFAFAFGIPGYAPERIVSEGIAAALMGNQEAERRSDGFSYTVAQVLTEALQRIGQLEQRLTALES